MNYLLIIVFGPVWWISELIELSTGMKSEKEEFWLFYVCFRQMVAILAWNSTQRSPMFNQQREMQVSNMKPLMEYKEWKNNMNSH